MKIHYLRGFVTILLCPFSAPPSVLVLLSIRRRWLERALLSSASSVGPIAEWSSLAGPPGELCETDRLNQTSNDRSTMEFTNPGMEHFSSRVDISPSLG